MYSVPKNGHRDTHNGRPCRQNAAGWNKHCVRNMTFLASCPPSATRTNPRRLPVSRQQGVAGWHAMCKGGDVFATNAADGNPTSRSLPRRLAPAALALAGSAGRRQLARLHELADVPALASAPTCEGSGDARLQEPVAALELLVLLLDALDPVDNLQ
jgi:hypothetical protein